MPGDDTWTPRDEGRSYAFVDPSAYECAFCGGVILPGWLMRHLRVKHGYTPVMADEAEQSG